jgi:hypothetical protein
MSALTSVAVPPVGHGREGLVPGDARPLALAALAGALQGIEDALGAVQVLAPGIPFLAAHGVHVRHAGLDGAIHAGLLLPHGDAIAHVDSVEAVAGVAVDAVAAPGYLVPGPLLAIEVFPGAVGRGTGVVGSRGKLVQRGLRHGYLPRSSLALAKKTVMALRHQKGIWTGTKREPRMASIASLRSRKS